MPQVSAISTYDQGVAMYLLELTPRNARALSACLTCDARAYSVCNAVEDASLARLGAFATTLEIAVGFSFIEEGDAPNYFFNMTSGVAKLYKLLPDGRRQVTGFARAGDFLGLAAGRGYGFSAEALDTVRVCRFSRSALTGLLVEFPALERRLLETASGELFAAQEQMLLLGRKTARERVASFLRAEAQRMPLCRHGSRVPLPMTRGDIADYLGLTIETVSRMMTSLRKAGVIAIPDATQFSVLDLDRLGAIADGTQTG